MRYYFLSKVSFNLSKADLNTGSFLYKLLFSGNSLKVSKNQDLPCNKTIQNMYYVMRILNNYLNTYMEVSNNILIPHKNEYSLFFEH